MRSVTLRASLFIFGLGSGFAWTAFSLIYLTVLPDDAGVVGETFFFGALFVALTGTLTMLGVLGRARSSALLPAFHIGPAFRQGFLLSTAAVGTLLLQRFRLLRWWNVLLLAVVLMGLDLFFARHDLKRAS